MKWKKNMWLKEVVGSFVVGGRKVKEKSNHVRKQEMQEIYVKWHEHCVTDGGDGRVSREPNKAADLFPASSHHATHWPVGWGCTRIWKANSAACLLARWLWSPLSIIKTSFSLRSRDNEDAF